MERGENPGPLGRTARGEPAARPGEARARRRLLLLIPTTSYRAEEFMAAAARLGAPVTVATEQASSLAGRQPEALLALDFDRPEVALQRLRAWPLVDTLAAVVGVDDRTTLVAATLARALGLPHNPPEAVAVARNKFRLRQRLRDAGLPGPRFALATVEEDPERLAAAAPYPCVLKPLLLSGSRGVLRADDPAAFVAAFRRIAAILRAAEPDPADPAARQILVESYLPGREVALEGLLQGGRLRVLCLFDKPDPLEGPVFEETLYVTPSRLPRETQAAVAACVSRAVSALGLVEGPVHAELRVHETGIWLLEVHPRSIGGRCSRVLRFGGGMSLEELILRHALGLEIPSLEREGRAAGVMMLPIPGAGVLEAIRGQEAALAVPGIEELILTAHPGQRLVPLPEGGAYPGFLFARGESPEAVERSLRRAHACLDFVLRPDESAPAV